MSVFLPMQHSETMVLVCVLFSQELSGADEETLRRELEAISELHEVETNNKCKLAKSPLSFSVSRVA